MEFISERDLPEAPGHSLESAASFLEACLHADGGDESRFPEGELDGFQWRWLQEWAIRERCIVPPELIPDREGGREHDVTFLEASGSWLKFTKPGQSGYTVDCSTGIPLFLPALPLDYLRRLLLQNELFGDRILLRGIQPTASGPRIVITQPDVQGEAPEFEEIDAILTRSFGFRLLDIPPMGFYKAHSFLHGDIGIFDAHPANFVKSKDGTLLPIDLILVRYSAAEAALLAKHKR